MHNSSSFTIYTHIMQCSCSDEIEDNKILWSRNTQDIRNVNTFYTEKEEWKIAVIR